MVDMYSGVYVFEGIDNVGKTTIIHALKQQIQETTDYRCVDIAFPGNEPRTLGNLVYNIHHHQEQYFNVPINETSLQLLHIASHIDLIQRQLMPLSNSRYIVLLDRLVVNICIWFGWRSGTKYHSINYSPRIIILERY